MLCESWQPISVQSPCRSRARGGVAQRQIGDPGSPFPLTWSTSICPSLWWGRALTLLVPLTNTGNKTYDLLCNVKSCKTTLSHSDFKKCRYAVTSDFLWPWPLHCNVYIYVCVFVCLCMCLSDINFIITCWVQCNDYNDYACAPGGRLQLEACQNQGLHEWLLSRCVFGC